ncbi:hypothetical protein MesoLjLb_18600 [Mesorhizobium sp. L-8-3]|nr:hypothetical protein MesoLjLb_18600 [Mesorhizobium sp. L-8-3]
MDHHNEYGPSGGSAGAVVVKNAVAASSYLTPAPLATEINAPEYAARKVAARFRLRIETARVVCHLAGLAVLS